MHIESGFATESPAAVIPWGISESALKATFGDNLRKVDEGHYTLSCISLGGLRLELGFHFDPKQGGTLSELEFFRGGHPDRRTSYREFQFRLERKFGPAHRTEPGDCGFQNHAWELGKVVVRHYVFDHYGPEEHVRIIRRVV